MLGLPWVSRTSVEVNLSDIYLEHEPLGFFFWESSKRRRARDPLGAARAPALP